MKPNQLIFSSVRFWFSSIWLFYIKNQKLYCFFGFFFVISNGFRFGSVFSGLALFCSVWLGSVWFFGFRLIELIPNQTGWFLKYSNRFNRFSFTVRFFRLIFFCFLGLISFLVFLLTPSLMMVSGCKAQSQLHHRQECTVTYLPMT